MAKYKVKTKAVINRQPVGSTIELDETSAKRLAKMKYVEIIEEVKTPPVKKASAPKKPAKKASTKKSETKTETKEK